MSYVSNYLAYCDIPYSEGEVDTMAPLMLLWVNHANLLRVSILGLSLRYGSSCYEPRIWRDNSERPGGRNDVSNR